LIVILAITIVVEGAVVAGYSIRWKKPFRSLLFTSIGVNLITQPFLWIVLTLFFRHYLIALLVAEILIWISESVLLYSVPTNQLGVPDAVLLSLSMNLASFALGWLLPI